MISIAALFPAGIAQQRQSVDDIIGPIVANNALAVLRSRLRPEDFGTPAVLDPDLPTIVGDFGWRRPAFFASDTTLAGGIFVPAGSISIFDGTLPNTTDSEIPWSGNAPNIVIGQGERYYPMRSLNSTDPFPPKPQYVWDCMFRSFQGRILVAIFVYRVTIPGGGRVTYAVPANPSGAMVPPLPFRQTLVDGWDAFGPDLVPGNADDAIVLGTPWDEYSAAEQNLSWQEPRQWILDQNNNIHRVLSQNRPVATDTDPIKVEMVRPVPQMAPLKVYFSLSPEDGAENIVSDIWYIPAEFKIDTNGDGTGDLPVTLSTVYATVREL